MKILRGFSAGARLAGLLLAYNVATGFAIVVVALALPPGSGFLPTAAAILVGFAGLGLIVARPVLRSFDSVSATLGALGRGEVTVPIPAPRDWDPSAPTLRGLETVRLALVEMERLRTALDGADATQREATRSALLETCQLVEADLEATARTVEIGGDRVAGGVVELLQALGVVRERTVSVARASEQASENA